MAPKKNWFAEFSKMEGAVTEHINPFNSGVHSTSPSADFIYGNGTWLLPFGYSEVLYGPPKGGKSVFVKMKIGQLHMDDPEAIAVVFDTEYRWAGQLTPEKAKMYGIDMKRCWVFKGNNPMLVFDRIEKDLAAKIQDGCPIKYIVIDSISGVLGRRELDSASVETQQIGDHALTVQTGLKRILGTIRDNKLATTIVAQVRSEMDRTEQMRGNKVKMNASFGLQHFAEYFIFIEQNATKDGRIDHTGKEFVNEDVEDLAGKGEKTGHKIRIKMKDSSMGPKGRVGEFTFDYHRGVINVHEEVFRLGHARNIITKGAGSWLEFGGKKWQGKQAMLQALEESPELQGDVLKALKEAELRGDFSKHDAALADESSIDDLDIVAV